MKCIGGSQGQYIGGRFCDIYGRYVLETFGREVMGNTWKGSHENYIGRGVIHRQYMEGKPCEIHGRKVMEKF